MKGQFYTPYQKGIIKRYYENKENLAHQKLGELVSDLYLEESPKKIGRLWAQIETALANAGTDKKQIAKLVKGKDIQALAAYINEVF